jgi:hypothetical protein
MATGLLVLAALYLASAQPCLAGDTIKNALTKGKVDVDLRYRYEYVYQDRLNPDTGDPLKTAHASTLRVRLGYTTATWYDLFAQVQFEGLVVVGNELYNSTDNGLTQYAVVPDPADQEFNQGYLGYSGVKDTTFKLGRQVINLDNQRYVGSVNWRQLQQTFDSFAAWSSAAKNFNFFLGYINNVNRVFGEHNTDPILAGGGQSSPLLNIAYTFPVGKLVGYGYWLEFEDVPGISHKDLGLRFTGDRGITRKVDLLYAGEYARQSPYKNGLSTNEASYYFAELAGRWNELNKLTFKLGYEVLGGDGGWGFQTPLATLHKFNGWADIFIITPDDGLRDLYFHAGGEVAGWKFAGVYHQFDADNGGADYGRELDLQAVKTFKKFYTLLFKYANYKADTHAWDTEKFWFSFEFKF